MALTYGTYSGMPAQQAAYAQAPQVMYEQAAYTPQQVVYEQPQIQYAQAPQVAYEYAAPQQVAYEYAAPQQVTYAQAPTVQYETFAQPAFPQTQQVMYETFAAPQAQVMYAEPQVACQTTAAPSYVQQPVTYAAPQTMQVQMAAPQVVYETAPQMAAPMAYESFYTQQQMPMSNFQAAPSMIAYPGAQGPFNFTTGSQVATSKPAAASPAAKPVAPAPAPKTTTKKVKKAKKGCC